MGWFSSSSSKKKDRSKSSSSASWNVFDPPTAYQPAPVPTATHHHHQRPPTAAPRPQYASRPPPPQSQQVYIHPHHQLPYKNHHASYSQPALVSHSPLPWPGADMSPAPRPDATTSNHPRPPPRPSRLRFADSVTNLAAPSRPPRTIYHDAAAHLDSAMARIDREQSTSARRHPDTKSTALITTTERRGSNAGFAKVELYANSKLPPHLPPLALYMPTWPLLCLAAQHSSSVYATPPDAAAAVFADADWRAGTKAMCVTAVPLDHHHSTRRVVIVLAVRGSTASFTDWAVNLATAPASPRGFLDDPGNLCHSGFLSVARAMVAPVAARLRRLLLLRDDDRTYSLLVTGHSAGGAVAALLYMHMLATARGTGSELNALAGWFKRIHCVTFGAPPVSLLPLRTPGASARRLRKSLFLAFVNEGDPVVRADPAYVRSLLELLTRPSPLEEERELEELLLYESAGPARRPELPKRRREMQQPHWPVPTGTLSNAGRIVVLRSGRSVVAGGGGGGGGGGERSVEDRLAEGVCAVTCEEEALRGVIWGDPVAHMMRLYERRIETLAVAAVTGKR